MARVDQRSALETLTKARLLELGETFELEVRRSMRVDELIETLAHSKRASFEKILHELKRAELKDICLAHDLDDSGKIKARIVARILGQEQEAAAARGSKRKPARKGTKRSSAAVRKNVGAPQSADSSPDPPSQSGTLPAAMLSEVDSATRATYYRCALRLLRFAERRSPTDRRFGPEADALWKDFAGGLKTTDRIDLLLRDADTEWPGAFGARAVFGLRAVAEDDAFGADWESLDPMNGERVWKDALTAEVATDIDHAIQQVCSGWELEATNFELPKVTATSRLLVGGITAIVATIKAFAANPDLSWADQVVVVADRPAERQAGAASAMLLNTQHGTTLRGSTDHGDEPKAPNFKRYIPVASPDATPEVREAIEYLVS